MTKSRRQARWMTDSDYQTYIQLYEDLGWTLAEQYYQACWAIAKRKVETKA